MYIIQFIQLTQSNYSKILRKWSFSNKHVQKTWNTCCSKIEILLVASLQLANNKGVDQTARMRRLVSAFVVRKHRRQIFSRRDPYPFVHSYNNLWKQLLT